MYKLKMIEMSIREVGKRLTERNLDHIGYGRSATLMIEVGLLSCLSFVSISKPKINLIIVPEKHISMELNEATLLLVRSVRLRKSGRGTSLNF